jgi:hypothetical protein
VNQTIFATSIKRTTFEPESNKKAMTQPQTLEQWLADEEQKQKKKNLEPNKEELIAQINQLNLELTQEKKVSQTWEEK